MRDTVYKTVRTVQTWFPFVADAKASGQDLVRRRLRRPHEADFALFRRFDVHGPLVIDVSTPTRLIEVGFVDAPGDAWDIAAAGGYVYVVGPSLGLEVFNLADCPGYVPERPAPRRATGRRMP